MKVFMTSFFDVFCTSDIDLHETSIQGSKLVQMWLVDIFLTSFKVNLDKIYTVSGPNIHSQYALYLNSCFFKVIYICNCKIMNIK